MSKKTLRSIGTHDGTFHADEVTACALLILFDLADEGKIVRTRDQELLDTCEFVCDVGGIYEPERKLFDHHQVDYQGGMSSAGMVLKYLRDLGSLNENEYRFFHDKLIKGVDDHDNGLDPQLPGVCTYSHILANFTPIAYDATAEEQNAAFFEALAFVKGHLSRMWQRYHYVHSCKEVVEAAMAVQDRFLFFDKAVPWMDLFFELGGEKHPALFVVMPSGQHWKVRGIPPSSKCRMDVRMPLPLQWAGLLEEELQKTSGIDGAIFCHKGRFISVWESKEDAMKALKFVLEGGE